ncbi:hypothetical protein NL676_029404, partial [Syzygium grande]
MLGYTLSCTETTALLASTISISAKLKRTKGNYEPGWPGFGLDRPRLASLDDL